MTNLSECRKIEWTNWSSSNGYELNVKQHALVGVWVVITTRQDKQQHRKQQQQRNEEQQRKECGDGVRVEPEESLSTPLPPPPPPVQQPPQHQLEEEQQGKQEQKRARAEPEESMSPPTPPPLWSAGPDWWLDRVSPPTTPSPPRKQNGDMEEQTPPPPPPLPPPLRAPLPAIVLPVDDGSLSGNTAEGILTTRLGFSFGRESTGDKTLDGDGGKRAPRRMRVGSIMGAGWRARVLVWEVRSSDAAGAVLSDHDFAARRRRS